MEPRMPKNTDYSYGHSVKRGVGNYTDSDPGLTPYRGVDQNGNPAASGRETSPPEANAGYAAPLPKK
jgi:hypothetical protein